MTDPVPVPCPIVATVTPFQRSGHIDVAALGDYLGLLKAAGVDTVLVNGTTGEFASLTVHERIRVAEYCRSKWRGVLVAHVGACAIGDAVELARHASGVADLLAVMNPFFFAQAPEAGIGEYFRAVLPHCDRPTLLYNFPRHTQAPIPARLAAQLLAEFPQIAGIKDSGKDRGLTRAYQALGPGFRVYLGDDRAGARIGEIGAAGVVTGAGGPVAELPVAIAAATAAGEVERAHTTQGEFDFYTDARKRLPISDIAFAKAAVSARLPGFPTQVRPPLSAASPDQAKEIHEVMAALLPRLRASGSCA
ncbi:dihydrodipicolinate synthase family protein [Nocardia carnea]|uniref:dihydrodipicolinate synthase family protein n=1 Tax=Nocardia carnea TaxID=37328 RepID=UPI0012F62ABB|nr:dihydrodipicolinate synthase family protein [Nocardia carnea]